MITYKNPAELARMRTAGTALFRALQKVKQAVRPGVSTLELDRIADEAICAAGCVPTSKGYGGFPNASCVSVGPEVVHGIPSAERILREGEIVSVDVTAAFEGYQADMARTFPVGAIAPEAALLIERTRQAFYEGFAQARAGKRVSDISAAVQAYAESFGYGVVRTLCGHGIGQEMHEDPEVPNFVSRSRGVRLHEGMTLCIEPMITAGHYDVYRHSNRWTYITRDHSLAAHYENTVAIRATEGPLLLTIPEDAEEDV